MSRKPRLWGCVFKMDGPAFPTDRRIPASSGGPATKAATPETPLRPFGKDGFSFRDLLDIINPLQHIPVVSTIYRKMTGDTLDAVPRVAGGTLFGGIVGAVSAVVNVVIEAASGNDIGANALAFLENRFSGSDPLDADPAAPDPDVMLARAPTFSAGWRAATAMRSCDAECLDPKTSFFSDAVSMAEAFPGAAAARYAKATGLAADATALRLDMHG